MVLYLKEERPVRIRLPRRVQVDRVHLVGIAGTGLRGLASILRQRGLEVSGSEPTDSPVLSELRRNGIDCFVGHRKRNVPRGTKLLVISAAVSDDNPEVCAAVKRGIPVLKYAEFVGHLMQERSGVAVAGTHGKTTTTAMTAQSLIRAQLDPGFIIGGEYPAIGGSATWGCGDHFVAEACEFDRSFLNLSPRYAIVTNIEEDHLDYFKSLHEIQGAFADFVRRLPEDGFLVLNADDVHSRFLSEHAVCPVGRFSLLPEGGDWWAEAIRPCGDGVCFRACSRLEEGFDVKLSVPGVHNVKNALAVIVLLRHLGVDPQAIVEALQDFTGVKRRFEVLLREPGVVIDDYAHHPTEIEMVLRAARETFAGRRLRVVFQPHQYSRTYRFLSDFARSLSQADDVLVTEVFAARDSQEDMLRINSRNLVDAVVACGGSATYADGFESVIRQIHTSFHSGEVLLCLGAGDITYLAAQLAEAIRQPVEEVV